LRQVKLPRSLLVPERMLMLTSPPEVWPAGTSKELVSMRISPMASAGGE
jgi:hypothetical protein